MQIVLHLIITLRRNVIVFVIIIYIYFLCYKIIYVHFLFGKLYIFSKGEHDIMFLWLYFFVICCERMYGAVI